MFHEVCQRQESSWIRPGLKSKEGLTVVHQRERLIYDVFSARDQVSLFGQPATN